MELVVVAPLTYGREGDHYTSQPFVHDFATVHNCRGAHNSGCQPIEQATQEQLSDEYGLEGRDHYQPAQDSRHVDQQQGAFPTQPLQHRSNQKSASRGAERNQGGCNRHRIARGQWFISGYTRSRTASFPEDMCSGFLRSEKTST